MKKIVSLTVIILVYMNTFSPRAYSQFMGINTPVPLVPLHVSSHTVNPEQVVMRVEGDNPNYAIIEANAINPNATVGYSLLKNNIFFAMLGVNPANDFFIKVGSNPSNAIYAKSSNNFVGINNTNPIANLDVNGTVKLGTNGSVITNIIKTTVNIGLIFFPANSNNTQTFAIPNAAIGSVVSISPNNILPSGIIIYNARVSSAGNVEVLLRNTTPSLISNFSAVCNLVIIL